MTPGNSSVLSILLRDNKRKLKDKISSFCTLFGTSKRKKNIYSVVNREKILPSNRRTCRLLSNPIRTNGWLMTFIWSFHQMSSRQNSIIIHRIFSSFPPTSDKHR